MPCDKAGLRAGGHRPLGLRHDPGARRAERTGVGAAEFVSRTGSSEERVARSSGRRPAGPRRRATEDRRSLYCNLGDVTNLAVARGTHCLFTRISPFGIEGIAQKLAERRELTLEHARQWLDPRRPRPARSRTSTATPETVAATREVLDEGAAKLADELRLSLEYYGAQEAAVAVEGIVACGPGTMIPGLVERLQRELGHPFRSARPAALGQLDEATRPASRSPTAWRWRSSDVRPVNLIPPESTPRRPGLRCAPVRSPTVLAGAFAHRRSAWSSSWP